jgi:O-antigen/teichoic acid export membrane protein
MQRNKGSLKARALRASSWVLFGHAGGLALRLASNLITTRLLAPEMFGLIAIAGSVAMLVALLSDIGIRESVIQSKRGDDPVLQNTAWTVQIVRGFITWIVASAVGGLMYLASHLHWMPDDSTYADPLLPAVVCGIAFSSVISGFRSTKLFIASRQLDLKRMTLFGWGSTVAGTVFTVGLAWLTGSVWSMVAGTLASTLVAVWLSHFMLPGALNRFAWDKSCLQELARFGRWVFVSSAMTVVASQGDRLLLGAFVSPDVLGIYSIALLMVSVSDAVMTRITSSVSFPALSEIARQDPQRLASVLLRMRRLTEPVSLGLAGLLIALGPTVVRLLYDSRYHDAGTMLQVLALSALVSRYTMFHQAYLAIGRPKYMAVLNVIAVLSLLVGLPLAYSLFGLTGALYAIALRGLVTVPVIFYFNARHGLNHWGFEAVVLLVMPLSYGIGRLALQVAGL